MPANYGQRLSSVVDIKMKEGSDKHFGVDGGIGLISSRLTVEGPIIKTKVLLYFREDEHMFLIWPSHFSKAINSREPIIIFTI